MAMHDDQLRIDEGTVRRLVLAQFPEWRDLPVTPLQTAATDNAIFLVGDALAARFPLRHKDAQQVYAALAAEADASGELADATTVATPRPVAIGQPGDGYPLAWMVQTWVPGTDAATEVPVGSHDFATDLASFIADLRAVDTRGRTFAGGGRGGHVHDHDAWVETCLANSVGLLDVPRLRRLWAEFRALPEIDDDVMCHGDLTPPNVLVDAGRLAGVVDCGGFAPADPALDLVAAWHLLDTEQRTLLRASLGCGDVQWRRGMAWAFQQAIGLVWYYAESNPTMSAFGRRTLDRLLAE